MYPSTKFQSVWRTSNFETKFAPKNMTDKNFEKTNIKIVISIQQCTPLQYFSHLVELQIMGSNLSINNMTDKKFEKINTRTVISI